MESGKLNGISAVPRKFMPVSEYKNNDHMAAVITIRNKLDEFIFCFFNIFIYF